MRGLMMDYPLTLPPLLDRAEQLFGYREIVTRRPDRSVHRYQIADFVDRSRRLAVALQDLGVTRGDRIATLGWNHQQHLEAYFGIPAAGAVLHTLNLRLHPDDISYIANHAGDRIILVDDTLLPLLERFHSALSTEHIIVMSQGDKPELPRGMLDYEELLAAADPARYSPPLLQEQDAAAMCYTSGTTGMPKGVLYSHRSMVLHAMALAMADLFAIGESTSYLPVVPMFHVNSWGTPFSCVMMGAKQVLPGLNLDPASICELLAQENVTTTAGVPTIWLSILEHLDENPDKYDLSALELMLVGGAAAPPSMIEAFESRHGLNVVHAWGMTETSPLGSVSHVGPHHENASADERLALRAKQGRMAPLVEIRAMNDGEAVPWNGTSSGELEVRGPWVASEYFDSEQGAEFFTDDGWFRTGDIVTIDSDGYIEIRDRAKDVIKSGGEWISSIALENALMGHPSITEAAVIAIRHPKWIERPLAVIVTGDATPPTLAEIRTYLEPYFAAWWLPDAVEVVDQIPRTSTGKFKKRDLRKQFDGYQLPETD
ncbi:MAG: long-chain-fatty-acid--CoA ligase [Acidobacteria bacterium]|nr:long-chain-fatty-acid--CoA ligase [Acidobacteriota bacterium]